eukprot:5594923-Pyramimonas_sp.AAC.1
MCIRDSQLLAVALERLVPRDHAGRSTVVYRLRLVSDHPRLSVDVANVMPLPARVGAVLGEVPSTSAS